MSNLCRQCGRSIVRGGYPVGGRGSLCRYCAVRATGLTTTALRAAHGARIAGENYRRVIKRLKDKVAKYEQMEASMQNQIDELLDSLSDAMNCTECYTRQMAKHGHE